MINPELLITTSYCVFSCLLYGLVDYLIIKNKKIFSGSYFNIILIDSAVNVCSYLISLISLRLPRDTCKECILASILPNIPGLNIIGCMWYHLIYVQYLMILSLIFNRFTAVAFPLKYNSIWERLFAPLMLFNLAAPFIVSYKWLLAAVSITYQEPVDSFMLSSIPDLYPEVNSYLIPSMIAFTAVNTALMVATFIVYILQSHRPDDSTETRLLVYSLVHFSVQLFTVVAVVIQYIGETWNIPILATIGWLGIPYVNEAATFSSPYILLFCSPQLRSLLKEMFLGKDIKKTGTRVARM